MKNIGTFYQISNITEDTSFEGSHASPRHGRHSIDRMGSSNSMNSFVRRRSSASSSPPNTTNNELRMRKNSNENDTQTSSKTSITKINNTNETEMTDIDSSNLPLMDNNVDINDKGARMSIGSQSSKMEALQHNTSSSSNSSKNVNETELGSKESSDASSNEESSEINKESRILTKEEMVEIQIEFVRLKEEYKRWAKIHPFLCCSLSGMYVVCLCICLFFVFFVCFV